MHKHHIYGGLYRLHNTRGLFDMLWVRLSAAAPEQPVYRRMVRSGTAPSVVSGWDAHIGKLVVTETTRRSDVVHNVFAVADTPFGQGAAPMSASVLQRLITLDTRLSLIREPHGWTLALDGVPQSDTAATPLAYWFGWLYGYFETYEYVNPEVDHLVYSLRVKMEAACKSKQKEPRALAMLRGYFKYEETYA